MSEVDVNNFKELLPQIRESFEKAKFFTIDLEFSALTPLNDIKPSLFDNNNERYLKLYKSLEHVIPIQVGVTAFHLDYNSDDYYGDVYNFYVSPGPTPTHNRPFVFDTSTIQFLSLYNFDFNKFAHSGIPYLDRNDEESLRKRLKSTDITSSLPYELQRIMDKITPTIDKWYSTSHQDDYLELPDVKQYKKCHELIYFIHKRLRTRWKCLWTYEQNDGFYVKKVDPKDFGRLSKEYDLDRDYVDHLIGFRHVFDLLSSLKKPVIGHNVLTDFVIMLNNFYEPLPKSYKNFKAVLHNLFPCIFDTKTIYYQLRKDLFKDRTDNNSSLYALYDYFKHGSGRLLTPHSPVIKCNIKLENLENYHEAGWDSYCTGYIFIRMAHCNVSRNYPEHKTFVSSELVQGLNGMRNCLNIIRGSSDFMKVDGTDPTTARPPWLVLESRGKSIDGQMVTNLLGHGYAETRPLTRHGDRLLVAVDNFRTAREILDNSKNYRDFHIRPYNHFRHSTTIRALIFTGVTLSGGLLIWLSHKIWKK